MTLDQKRACRIHRGIGSVRTEKDFGSFRECLGEAFGKVSNNLRSPYRDALKRDFVLSMMANTLEGQIEIMKHVALLGKIYYVCPVCLDGFKTPAEVPAHSTKWRDDCHTGLQSEDLDDVKKCYEAAVGQPVQWGDIHFESKPEDDLPNLFAINTILRYKSRLLDVAPTRPLINICAHSQLRHRARRRERHCSLANQFAEQSGVSATVDGTECASRNERSRCGTIGDNWTEGLTIYIVRRRTLS